jgi:hypothetical protein
MVGILIVVPYVLANYAQNVFIVRMLSDPSAASIWLTSVASILVMAKFVLALAAMAVIAVVFQQSRDRS